MSGGKGDDLLLRGLLADSHGLPVLVLKHGIVRRVNQAAAMLFDRDPVNLHVRELLDEDSVTKLNTLMESAGPASTELQVESPGAPPIPNGFTVLPLPGGEWILVGWSLRTDRGNEVRDSLMVANEELVRLIREHSREVRLSRAAHDALAEISSVRDLLMAALAHDVRSPLNAILVAEALLCRNSPESPTLEHHSGLVQRNVQHILDLIDNLVLAAQDEAAREAPTNTVHVDEVARAWVDAVGPIATEAGVQIVVLVNGPATVVGDRVQIGEVFSNLISNAIRHSPQGECVTVEVGSRQDHVMCSVADRGTGVPPAQREEIFYKFVQGAGLHGSSGLGLYISRRVVERHGGRIWVEDNTPVGARFVFKLPSVLNSSRR